MRAKTPTVVWIHVVLSALLLAGFGKGRVQAQLDQRAATLQVVPQVTQLAVGETSTFDLTIDEIADLYGVEVHLRFDPEALEVVDADPSTAGIQVQSGTFPAPDFVVQNQADNDAGTIDYTVVQLPPSEPGSGSGVAAVVTFRAKQPTVSRIEIESFVLADTTGHSIGAVHRDGQVRVRRAIPWVPIAAAGTVLALAFGGAGYAVRQRRKSQRPRA
jgi:hypothetical protein